MGRIIVVEDNLTFSGYVCRLLKSKGFQAVSASTCNGAHKLFAKMCEDDIVLAEVTASCCWMNFANKGNAIPTSS